MPSNKQKPSFFKNHKWSTILLSFLIFLILISVLIRALLGVSIEYVTKHWLMEQNIDADIGSIEIHLLQGRVSVFNFHGKNQQQQGFSLGELTVAWDWKPLLDNAVHVKHISINKLNLDSAFYNNGKIQIAGLSIPVDNSKNNSRATATDNQTTAWNINIDTVDLNNIELCTKQFSNDSLQYDYCGEFSHLHWEGSLAYKPDNKESVVAPLYVDGNFSLQGLKLHNNKLKLDLLNIKDLNLNAVQVKTTDNIQINTLNIKEFSALERETDNTESINRLVSFEDLSINPIQLINRNALSIDKIALTNLQTYYYVDKTGHSNIDPWLAAQSETTTPATEKLNLILLQMQMAFHTLLKTLR